MMAGVKVEGRQAAGAVSSATHERARRTRPSRCTSGSRAARSPCWRRASNSEIPNTQPSGAARLRQRVSAACRIQWPRRGDGCTCAAGTGALASCWTMTTAVARAWPSRRVTPSGESYLNFHGPGLSERQAERKAGTEGEGLELDRQRKGRSWSGISRPMSTASRSGEARDGTAKWLKTATTGAGVRELHE